MNVRRDRPVTSRDMEISCQVWVGRMGACESTVKLARAAQDRRKSSNFAWANPYLLADHLADSGYFGARRPLQSDASMTDQRTRHWARRQ